MVHPQITVIIPIGPGEHAWVDLVNDLALLPNGTEIIFATIRQYSGFRHAPALAKLQDKKVLWVFAHPGRAHLMNAAAKEAQHPYLWFLHADSRFSRETIQSLFLAIKDHPQSLLYADLNYENSDRKLAINKYGSWLRSHLCNLVIGQQGMCISHKLFNKAGKFPLQPASEEDLLFVVNALNVGILPKAINASITTRSRHYDNEGWFRLTVKRMITSFHYVPAAGLLTLKNRLRILK